MLTKKQLKDLLSEITAGFAHPETVLPEAISLLLNFLETPSLEFMSEDTVIPAPALQRHLQSYDLNMSELVTAATLVNNARLNAFLESLQAAMPEAAGSSLTLVGRGAGAGLFSASGAGAVADNQDRLIKKIKDLGVTSELLDALKARSVIREYKNLYERLRLFVLSTGGNYAVYGLLAKIEPWELCCLSGELAAIRAAETAYGLKWDNKESFNVIGSPLHCILMSGSPDALSRALIKYEASCALTKEVPTYLRCSRFEYRNQQLAALGGNPFVLEKAIDLDGGKVLMDNNHPITTNLSGYHIGHMAALNGGREIMDYVADLARCDRWPLLAPSVRGVTVVHSAAMSGKVSALDKALAWAAEPESFISEHARKKYTSWYPDAGDKEKVRTAIRQYHFNWKAEGAIEPKDSTTNKGETLLHFAALGGSIDMCTKLLELGLNVATNDFDGNSTMAFAARSSSIALVAYLNETHDINLIKVDNSGNSILHIVAFQGNRTLYDALVRLFGLNTTAVNKLGLTPPQMAYRGVVVVGAPMEAFEDLFALPAASAAAHAGAGAGAASASSIPRAGT